MQKKHAKLEINRKALLRLTMGVGFISSVELVICLWLGMIPPDSRMKWILAGVLVGGPILLTFAGVVSYFVLTRLGVDVPTDTKVGEQDRNYLAARARYGALDDE